MTVATLIAAVLATLAALFIVWVLHRSFTWQDALLVAWGWALVYSAGRQR